ncbi:hypothetical protein D3C85_378140 [compost metagenome]
MSSKKPWETHPDLWKTEAAWLSYVRGGIRRGLWKNYGPKLKFLKSRAKLVDNPNPKSQKRFPKVKMWQCEQCGEWFTSKDVNVDHRTGNNSLRCVEDIGSFVEAMLLDCSFDDYAILCVECHKIKSHSDSKGISFEEAEVDKIALSLCKKKLDIAWLKAHNITPASSAPKRRAQIREILMEELKNGNSSN